MSIRVAYRRCSLFLLGSVLGCGASGGVAPQAGDGGPGPDTVVETTDATDSPGAALPVCTPFASSPPVLPSLTPRGSWGDGPHVYELVSPTANGWTLRLVSGTPPGTDSVVDEGKLLAGFVAGDRLSVDGVTRCQPFSGCKSYQVVTNAADRTLIAATYSHDSDLAGFSALLGIAVSLEPVCRSAQPDGCYPGAIAVQNRLRFGDEPARIGAGSTGSIAIAGRTVRVAAGRLLTLSGGAASTCLDAGSFWRGGQTFNLAR